MVQFIDLWRGHPLNESIDYPCLASADGLEVAGRVLREGDPTYVNQSAIRMGVALRRAGVRIEQLGPKLATCTLHDRAQMHILNPRQLAEAVRRAKLPGFGEIELITGSDVQRFQVRLIGRTGVLYVRDYWMRTNDQDGQPTGDLIDLWNGYRTTESWLMEWMAWAGYRSAYTQAREMWFWPVV